MPKKCACRVKPSKGQGFRVGNYGVVTAGEVDVLMCPLHAAAEDMAQLLESAVNTFEQMVKDRTAPPLTLFWLDEARAALAKAGR